jgi:D-alanyl-D-alanine carboxypeptidase/D-alanyl-D-alanine-endopeptidase (penicillin-binding protein 4)
LRGKKPHEIARFLDTLNALAPQKSFHYNAAMKNDTPDYEQTPVMSNRCKFIALALTAIIIALLPSTARARIDLSSALADPGFDPNHTSVVVAEASTGKVIASHMPNLKLNPASCAKILTSVTALAQLGPDYRFTTSFYADRMPVGGSIGTLYVKGSGDPSLINEELERIAMIVRAMGITRITDGIVIDDSFFDSYEYPRKGGNAGRAYTAKTSAVSVNFNSIGVEVAPGKPGGAGKIELKPPVDLFTIVNKLVTRSKTSIAIALGTGKSGNGLTVTGRISPKAGKQIFWRAIPDPLSYAGAVMVTIFGEGGIAISGPTRRGIVPTSAVLLTEEKSRPLIEIIRDMNKLSTNFVAEQLVKHMGGVFKGAPGSTAKGVAVIQEYVDSIGIPQGSIVLENGSGLSSVSKVSADQLVKVLVAAYRNRAIQTDFMSSLSVLGIDGTMKKWMKMEPTLTGIVYAKTGTLDSVSTLAGYVPMPDGSIAAFAILANGLPKGPWAAKKAQLGIVKQIAGVSR